MTVRAAAVFLLLATAIMGCHDLTVEDVAEACVEQCFERGGGSDCAGPECLRWARSYSDCVPEAYALAVCMPGECSAEADDLYACARAKDLNR
jgi:hypothetical protein